MFELYFGEKKSICNSSMFGLFPEGDKFHLPNLTGDDFHSPISFDTHFSKGASAKETLGVCQLISS